MLTLATATAPRMMASVRAGLGFGGSDRIFQVDFREGGLTCVMHPARGGRRRLLRVLGDIPNYTVICAHGQGHAHRVTRLLIGGNVATAFCRTNLGGSMGSRHRGD